MGLRESARGPEVGSRALRLAALREDQGRVLLGRLPVETAKASGMRTLVRRTGTGYGERSRIRRVTAS